MFAKNIKKSIYNTYIKSRSLSNLGKILNLNFFPRIDRNEEWVFSRSACLGNDVFALLNTGLTRLNYQKGRIDSLLNYEFRNNFLIRREINKIIPDLSIRKMIFEQHPTRIVKLHPPKFILMDNFSELTDQRFQVKKTGYNFYCNFSDVQESIRTSESVRRLGLVNRDSMLRSYRSFLEFVQKSWEGVPVLMIIFPQKYENREVYLEQGGMIDEVFLILQTEYDNFKVIQIDAIDVARFAGDENRYHFALDTKYIFAEKVRSELS